MLNRNDHQSHMGRIVTALYKIPSIAPYLGFKGGTCAYFFYNLPRFSVDLDFDWIGEPLPDYTEIFQSITAAVQGKFEIKDSYVKYNTLFWLLSYGKTEHNIKIEISARVYDKPLRPYYEVAEHFGTPVLIAKKPYMFATKLVALTDRKKFATRDIFDVWYFTDENWQIDRAIIQQRTNKTLSEQITACIARIESISDKEVLSGLGELLTESQKSWTRDHLRKETISLLKNYQSAFGEK